MTRLTSKGDAIRSRMVTYLEHYQREKGYMPTIAGMSRDLDISKGSVQFHLAQLRIDGKVFYEDRNMARTLVLL